MRIKKEEVKAKLDAGGCLTYGCVSFHKWDGEYFYGRPAEIKRTRATEVFENFDDLWREISHYLIYGIDYLDRAPIDPRTKECKCGVRIPINQDTCYACWRWDRLDKEHRRFVQKHVLVPPHEKGKRRITKKQEHLLHLCHQDFEGLSQTEAAERLGIKPSVVSIMLKRIKKVLPEYFPILTALEYKIYNLYMNEGWDVPDIAEYLEKTDTAIRGTLRRTKDKGCWWAPAIGRIASYDALRETYKNDDDETTDDNQLDSKVKQKF